MSDVCEQELDTRISTCDDIRRLIKFQSCTSCCSVGHFATLKVQELQSAKRVASSRGLRSSALQVRSRQTIVHNADSANSLSIPLGEIETDGMDAGPRGLWETKRAFAVGAIG